MIVLPWNHLVQRKPPLDRPVRLTIGVFDGLHIGHRKLMDGIVTGAGDILPLVITFRQSPSLLLTPGAFPGFLLTFSQKLSRLDALGVGAVVAIDFSEELSNLSGKGFIKLLTENLTIQKIVVGQNFRFGKNRISGTDDLKEMLSGTGIELQVTEPVIRGDAMVSSSRIRSAIREAKFTEARGMLAADYSLDLRGLASRSDSPTSLRIARNEVTQVLPQQGDYDVSCTSPAGTRPGRLTIGNDSLMLGADGCGDITMVDFTE